MSVLVFLIVSYILLSISLCFLFKKTDVNPTHGLIPGLNFIEWCKLIGRKPVFALWLLFPIVNIFIFCGMAVDLVRSFGFYKFRHSAFAVIYAPAIFFAIAFSENARYEGAILPREAEYQSQIKEAEEKGDKYLVEKLRHNNPYGKSASREWTESIIFAVFAASFIRMFLIEAYIIPTPSMEGSLLVGDFLFVSKAHYGIRMPQTIASLPLLHNRIPIIGTESYLKKPQLPYYRLPKITDVQLNDPFVFNWPAGDSVYITSTRSYSAFQATQPSMVNSDPEFRRAVEKGDLVARPMDKTDFYIKRCVGLPGDTLEIRDAQIYINGEATENPEKMQFAYRRIDSLGIFNPKSLEKNGVLNSNYAGRYGSEIMFLTDEQRQILLEKYPSVKLTRIESNPDPISYFPNDPKNFRNWTGDDFGPIYIPAKGETVVITPNNLSLYKRIIGTYEGNDLEVKNGRIYINGEKSTEYTFQQNYYWAMGDNRHASEDSRYWGFVPADHIVGKPLFIWMSIKNRKLSDGIRFNRIFKSASK